MSDGAAGCEGRRPKASRGGNRGNGYVRRRGGRYGDLAPARTTAEARRCDAASWRTVQRVLNDERTVANVAIVCVIWRES